ncbi:hypothetical protein [Streptomyces sp. NPDC050164]|uniref:hypothetical protein n=1 Tax=Streptomyces sp. NPDC050164 TaxID=3365605 RepID=UPI003798C5B8
MTMPPRLRQAALIAHVTSSVGWLGAVVAFLALAVIGMTSRDPATVRGAYLVMEPAAWYVLVPLSFAALLTGLVQSLGTSWGLVRHYWVLFKLLINVVATGVLLIYTGTFRSMAHRAADPGAELASVRNFSPVLHSLLALAVLLAAMVLAVYKPRGVTPYGQRRRQAERESRGTPGALSVSRT